MVLAGIASIAASATAALVRRRGAEEVLAAVFLLLVFRRAVSGVGWRGAARGPRISLPTDRDLDAARTIIQCQPWARPHLVFLRDKAVMFDGSRHAFVMFATQRRSWIALGDPVGRAEDAATLIRRFVESSEASGGVPVFYQVRDEHLSIYRQLGFRAVKLGEEGRVDLSTFSLTGGHWSKTRQNLRRLERAGVGFRVVPAAETPAIMARLEAVSDEWLRGTVGGEKGFSLGRFRPDYVARFDVAVMEKEGEILAFANLWATAHREELATDLFRHRRDAPPETMEALLVWAMSWGKSRGYRWFSLGMAPLAGLDALPAATWWSRLGAFVYAHGEPVYHFRGVKTFKQKFHPQWESRYLVYREGAFLPAVGADIAALVAGGYRKVIFR